VLSVGQSDMAEWRGVIVRVAVRLITVGDRVRSYEYAILITTTVLLNEICNRIRK
jgi:hypothetical protein